MSGIASKAEKRGGTRLSAEEVVITAEELVTWPEIVLPTGEMVAGVNLLPRVEAKMALRWAHVRSGSLGTRGIMPRFLWAISRWRVSPLMI